MIDKRKEFFQTIKLIQSIKKAHKKNTLIYPAYYNDEYIKNT